MRFKIPSFILALALVASNALAAPQVRYRITPITAPPGTYIVATGLNLWGEVVGSWAGDIGQHGFYWRNGNLVDLNDQVYPNASYVEVSSINNRSQITGNYADPSFAGFRGFVLEGGESRDVEGPPGSVHVFAGPITDRGVIRGASYDAEGNYTDFLNDHGAIQVFDSSVFEPAGMNEFGVVSGRSNTGAGSLAALWKDGAVTIIGPAYSSAVAINERGQVIGTTDNNVSARAFLYERGQLKPLPKLRADQTYSWPSAINNFGRIVGTTVTNLPGGSVSVATVWDGGQVFALDALIHQNDPLRAFVKFHDANLINDLGQVIALGVDSRLGTFDTFLLTPALQW